MCFPDLTFCLTSLPSYFVRKSFDDGGAWQYFKFWGEILLEVCITANLSFRLIWVINLSFLIQFDAC